MSDLSDEQRERQIRSRGNAATKEMRALLRLLDAERARADAAEAKAAAYEAEGEKFARSYWDRSGLQT